MPNKKIKFTFNNREFEIDFSEITKWTEFACQMALLKSHRDSRKRRILNILKKDRMLVVEMMGIADIDKELEDIPEIDYSNSGMYGSKSTPFKVT